MSLRRESVGPCIKCSPISRCFPKNWLLSHLSQSAHWICLSLDDEGPLKIKVKIWTSTKLHKVALTGAPLPSLVWHVCQDNQPLDYPWGGKEKTETCPCSDFLGGCPRDTLQSHQSQSMDGCNSRCLDATEDTERVWGMLLLQKTHGTVDRHQREQEVMNFWIKEEKKWNKQTPLIGNLHT